MLRNVELELEEVLRNRKYSLEKQACEVHKPKNLNEVVSSKISAIERMCAIQLPVSFTKIRQC